MSRQEPCAQKAIIPSTPTISDEQFIPMTLKHACWMSLLSIGASVCLATAPHAAVNELPVLGDVDSEDLSPVAERRLGELVMKSYRAQGAVYDDREVTDYLNRFGSKIVASSKGAGTDFEFFLVKDSTLNAFALPGGFIGVHSGLIVAAQTEAELASVLAHEVGHVTQRHIARMFGKQRQTSLISMAAVALAILAARSGGGQATAGIMAAGTGLAASQQLGFSRDAEREADRVGYQTLVAAGFDPNAMVTFFTRLQQGTRLYENNAPAYLKTHPLTVERIADIQNRVGSTKPKPIIDNLEYQLVRAKMKVIGDESTDGLKSSIAQFIAASDQMQLHLPAAKLYGQSLAWMRLGEWDKATATLNAAAKLTPQSQPMLERLGIEIRLAQALKGQAGTGVNKGKSTVKSTPTDKALLSEIADDALALRTKHNDALSTTLLALEALQRAGRYPEVEDMLRDELQLYKSDPELYERMAEAQDALGKKADHHVSLSYSYELQGAYTAAIEQMNLAKRNAGNDFYLQSQIDVRLKALQAQAAEAMKERL